MFQKFLLCICTLLFTAGCTDRYADYFPYQDDGTKKPHVAFLPMLDDSNFCEDESLSEELTIAVCREMMFKGGLYLIPDKWVAKMMAECGSDTDYFGKDLSFANQFDDADFIVITELFEHEIVPRDQIQTVSKIPCGPGAYFAVMKVRIRIIDCRCERPRIALQEILETHQAISAQTACNPSNKEGFKEARKRLTEQLVSRLENVLWSCR